VHKSGVLGPGAPFGKGLANEPPAAAPLVMQALDKGFAVGKGAFGGFGKDFGGFPKGDSAMWNSKGKGGKKGKGFNFKGADNGVWGSSVDSADWSAQSNGSQWGEQPPPDAQW